MRDVLDSEVHTKSVRVLYAELMWAAGCRLGLTIKLWLQVYGHRTGRTWIAQAVTNCEGVSMGSTTYLSTSSTV